MIEKAHDPLGTEVGDRVELVACTDEYTRLKPDATGVVTFIDSTGTVFVRWDDGHRLGLLPGVDRWTILR